MPEDGKMLLEEARRQVSEMQKTVIQLKMDYGELKKKIESVSEKTAESVSLRFFASVVFPLDADWHPTSERIIDREMIENIIFLFIEILLLILY